MSIHHDELEFDLGFKSEDDHSPVHKKRKHEVDSIKNAFNDPNDVYFGDQKEKFMVKHIGQVEHFPLMNTWTIPSPINTVKKRRTYTKHNTGSKRKTCNKTGGKRKTDGKRKTGKRKTRKTK